MKWKIVHPKQRYGWRLWVKSSHCCHYFVPRWISLVVFCLVTARRELSSVLST